MLRLGDVLRGQIPMEVWGGVMCNPACETTDKEIAYMRVDCAEARGEFEDLKRAIDERPSGPNLTPRQLRMLLRCDVRIYPNDTTPLQYVYDTCRAAGLPSALYRLCVSYDGDWSRGRMTTLMLEAMLPRHAKVLEIFVDEAGFNEAIEPVAIKWALCDGQGHGPSGERCRMVEFVGSRYRSSWNSTKNMFGTFGGDREMFERYFFYGSGAWSGCDRCLRRLRVAECNPYTALNLLRLIEMKGTAGLITERAQPVFDYFRSNGWQEWSAFDYTMAIVFGDTRLPKDVTDRFRCIASDRYYRCYMRPSAMQKYADRDDALVRLLNFGGPFDQLEHAVALCDLATRVGLRHAVELVCDRGALVRVLGKSDCPEGSGCRFTVVLKYPRLLWTALRQGELGGEDFVRLLRRARDPVQSIVHLAAVCNLSRLPGDRIAVKSAAYIQLCEELSRFEREPQAPDVAAALDSISAHDARFVLKKSKRAGRSHLSAVAAALKRKFCAPLAVGRCQAASPLSLLDDHLILQIARYAANLYTSL